MIYVCDKLHKCSVKKLLFSCACVRKKEKEKGRGHCLTLHYPTTFVLSGGKNHQQTLIVVVAPYGMNLVIHQYKLVESLVEQMSEDLMRWECVDSIRAGDDKIPDPRPFEREVSSIIAVRNLARSGYFAALRQPAGRSHARIGGRLCATPARTPGVCRGAGD